MEYRTVACEASAEFIEKKSRFIGYIKPVKEEEEATSFINDIKSRHYDATHNVYAYILRNNNYKRYSDDGEPQGTAGLPVLDVLQKEGLSDVAVVVTRYFGGTLLGAGGLVRAYTKGAKIAVDAAGIVVMKKAHILRVSIPYTLLSSLQKEITSRGGKILEADYTDSVSIKFSLPLNEINRMNMVITEMSGGQIEAEIVGETYQPEKN